MLKTWLLWVAPGLLAAQTPGPRVAPTGNFGGVGLGNALGMHSGYIARHWLLLGRARYKWWGPASGPGSSGLTQGLNTRSRQLEVAALAGYGQPVGRNLVYAAAGLGYVAGRQLGNYRYTVRGNGFLADDTHYYSYRSYRAIGLPLEAGVLLPLPARHLGLGVALQANLNPEQSVYCLLLTIWGGKSVNQLAGKP